MSKHNIDAPTSGDMPTGSMAGFFQEPGTVVDEMPPGVMQEGAQANQAMPEGQPGEQGDMPGDPPTEEAGTLNDMPAGAMAEGEPGVEGAMPSGLMEASPQRSAAAPAEETPEAPVMEITGNWQLKMWVSQIIRS